MEKLYIPEDKMKIRGGKFLPNRLRGFIMNLTVEDIENIPQCEWKDFILFLREIYGRNN